MLSAMNEREECSMTELTRRDLARGTAALAASAAIAGGAVSAQESLAEDPLRPQFHYTPAIGWMNDPNGLVYIGGEYHLFHQWHPGGWSVGGKYEDPLRWGPMHWAHATSRDLVRWERLPTAIAPQTGPGAAGPVIGTVYSGSAVVDWQNTSDLGAGGRPPIVAIFTETDLGKDGNQRQSLAHSTDGGLTFARYDRNPVLPNPGTKDFRDPKVIWHAPSGRWVMVLAAGDRIAFHTSPDLKAWTHASDFRGHGSDGFPWECPDLFELTVDGDPSARHWVLLVSQGKKGLQGGSATQYFTGRFDGTTFTSDHPPESIRWLDHGRDNYAGITWSDEPETAQGRLFIGWMSNWDYGQNVPASTFRSAMTVPRRIALRSTDHGLRLVTEPVPELRQLRSRTLFEAQRLVVEPGADPLAGLESDCLEIEAEIDAAAAAGFAFHVRVDEDERTVIGWDPGRREVYVDRSRHGAFAFQDAGRHAAPVPAGLARLRLRILVDRSSVEVFAADGLATITDLIFPKDGSRDMALVVDGGPVTLHSLHVYRLSSIYG